MRIFLIVLATLLLADIGLATTTTTLMVVPTPSATSDVVSFLGNIESQIPVSLPAAAVIILALLSEIALRVFPTKKPKSLLLVVSAVLGKLGSIFTKVSGLLDQVIQNIKDPEEKK